MIYKFNRQSSSWVSSFSSASASKVIRSYLASNASAEGRAVSADTLPSCNNVTITSKLIFKPLRTHIYVFLGRRSFFSDWLICVVLVHCNMIQLTFFRAKSFLYSSPKKYATVRHPLVLQFSFIINKCSQNILVKIISLFYQYIFSILVTRCSPWCLLLVGQFHRWVLLWHDIQHTNQQQAAATKEAFLWIEEKEGERDWEKVENKVNRRIIEQMTNDSEEFTHMAKKRNTMSKAATDEKSLNSKVLELDGWRWIVTHHWGRQGKNRRIV